MDYAPTPEFSCGQNAGSGPTLGDLRDPIALATATRGIAKVCHIAPSLTVKEHEMGRAVISAAIEAGVQYFVLHGVIAPYLQHINYHGAKELLQLDLYRSEMFEEAARFGIGCGFTVPVAGAGKGRANFIDAAPNFRTNAGQQGSQQGEVQEIELESLLQTKFPQDVIEPVPKGEFGGDVLQYSARWASQRLKRIARSS